MADLELGLGEDHSVTLEDRGGAGYVWQVSVRGHAVEVSADRRQAPERPPPGSPPPDASGVRRIITLTAVAPGAATVTFRLVRPWLPDADPLETRSLEIAVSEAGGPR